MSYTTQRAGSQISRRDDVQPLTTGMRWMLYVASGLVLIAGIPLFLLSTETDRYFAWTINPPITAAFLGASFWASCVLEFLSARRDAWARARVAVPAVLVFTTLTLFATVYHFDRFHQDQASAWIWLIVYAVVPPVMLVLFIQQLRVPGQDPERVQPLPSWMRLVLATQCLVMVGFGLALFIAPETVGDVWPWTLTALTGQAIGAWLIGLGIAAGHAAWENDISRVYAVILSSLTFGVLQFVALARFSSHVEWDEPSAWAYLVALLSVLLVGIGGLLEWRRLPGLGRFRLAGWTDN